jgi:hypothetical protein
MDRRLVGFKKKALLRAFRGRHSYSCVRNFRTKSVGADMLTAMIANPQQIKAAKTRGIAKGLDGPHGPNPPVVRARAKSAKPAGTAIKPFLKSRFITPPAQENGNRASTCNQKLRRSSVTLLAVHAFREYLFQTLCVSALLRLLFKLVTSSIAETTYPPA